MFLSGIVKNILFKERNTKKKESVVIKIILLITFFVFLSFGFYHLTKFVTADEHYWIYERVPQYWKAIKEHNLKKTLINDKPGVTVALISGIGLFFEKNPETHQVEIDANLTKYDIDRSPNIYFAYRFPVLLFSGFFLFLIFWIISKNTNQWIALWSIIFMALSPVLLGISQIINPDSMLWLFSIAAVFFYCVFLKKQKLWYAFFAAIFTGLAILSKYTANILFPFYIFLSILYYIIEFKDISRIVAGKYFKINILGFLAVVAGAIFTIIFFLPAIFVKPVYLYRLTIGFSDTKILWFLVLASLLFLVFDTFVLKNLLLIEIKKFFTKYYIFFKLPTILILALILVLIIGRNFFLNWQLFEVIPFDIKNLSSIEKLNYFPNFLEKMLLELNTFVFSVTPIVLFLSLYIWIKCVIKKSVRFEFYIISFAFLFLYMRSHLLRQVF